MPEAREHRVQLSPGTPIRSQVKELLSAAVAGAPRLHRERRKFLRTALKELGLVFTDQPGLLGPKVTGEEVFRASIGVEL